MRCLDFISNTRRKCFTFQLSTFALYSMLSTIASNKIIKGKVSLADSEKGCDIKANHYLFSYYRNKVQLYNQFGIEWKMKTFPD